MLKTRDYLKELKNQSFHKLIIGAALKDYKAIEDFSYYFTHAEADVLDISAFPHSVLCAKKGIEKALKEDSTLTEPLIMVSVNIGEDPHFRRIEINWDNCTECLACVPTCPSNAFTDDFSYNPDLCFGCSACLPSCSFDAFSFENWSAFEPTSLIELQGLGARAIEIHLNNDLEAFKTFYSSMPEFELESFCIGSERMTEKELKEATQVIIETVSPKKDSFIIQVDGIPLSGAREMGIEKDLVSIRNAKIVKEYAQENHPNLKIFIQLAGGITETSLTKAKEQGLETNGVAIGSYARKLLQESDEPVKAAKKLIAISKQYSGNKKQCR